MRIAKKAIAVFLTLTLVISVMPMSAFADTTPDPMKDAVESIDAIEQSAKESEKDTLEDRKEEIKNNTVEVTSGSDKGFVLENEKIYVFKKDVEFTNSTPSGSAITVPEGATATMLIEKDVTVTATGADSVSATGAGAGIYVPDSAKLIIRGEGTLKAAGGNAGDGEKGANGDHARFDKDSRNGNGLIFAGNGGAGGPGGGGAGGYRRNRR